jgi:lysophospholipase L1-like esterase
MTTADGTARGAWLAWLELGYPLSLAALGLGTALALATLAVWRPGRSPVRRLLLRGTLAGLAALMALLVAEAAMAASLAWIHRLPRLAMAGQGPRASGPGADVTILVVGESSAEGVPYKDWLSVGKIVAWKLRRVFPQRMFHVEVQARAGWTLEQMHQRLSESPRGPDVVLLYAGHNEFASRYGWSDSVPYYDDEPPPPWPRRLARAVAAHSPLCRLLAETSARERVAARPPAQHRPPVDVPSCTADQYAERLADFERRLEAILADLKRAGALPVLIVPPGNDAGFEPSRSVLPPETPRAVREAFAAAMAQARALEETDSPASANLYRALIAEQPEFAEAHFRLARLLERQGDRDSAYRHYVLARDLDAHPMRCPTAFQDVYRRLAPAFDAILVDGQEVFRSRHPGGLLDDSLFNDAMHPSLAGHALLAEAVLAALRERHAFGWASSVPAPVVDPSEVAEHFDVSAATWKAVCRFAAGFYRTTLPIRFDPAEREIKARRYEAAIRRLEEGASPEQLNYPGVGVRPSRR